MPLLSVVFVAFIAVIRLAQKYKPEYVFIRNRALALTVEYGVLPSPRLPALPAGIFFPQNGGVHAGVTFQPTLNIVTPFVRVGLGLIFPLHRRA